MKQKTLLKIMNLMRNNLDKGYTILEISKILKIGYRPAYMHTNTMEIEGIINVEKIGNAKKCSPNLKNEKCRRLLEEVDIERREKLFGGNKNLKKVLDDLISKLTQKLVSDIHSIVLFGSYAKGSAKKSSDIDLFFIVRDLKDKEIRTEIERECTSYEYSHGIKINPLISDIDEFKKMLESKELNVGKEVKNYGVAFYGIEQFWRLIAWKELIY